MLKFYATFFSSDDTAFHCCEMLSLVSPRIGQRYPYECQFYEVTNVAEKVIHLKAV